MTKKYKTKKRNVTKRAKRGRPVTRAKRMKRAKRGRPSTRRAKQTRLVRASKTAESPANPYSRRSKGKYPSLYTTTFEVGSQKFWDKDELINEVAEITHKTKKRVEFALQVIGNPNHPTNKGKNGSRSKRIEEDGKIKIVDIRISRGGAKGAEKKETPAQPAQPAPQPVPVVEATTKPAPQAAPEPAPAAQTPQAPATPAASTPTPAVVETEKAHEKTHKVA